MYVCGQAEHPMIVKVCVCVCVCVEAEHPMIVKLNGGQ